MQLLQEGKISPAKKLRFTRKMREEAFERYLQVFYGKQLSLEVELQLAGWLGRGPGPDLLAVRLSSVWQDQRHLGKLKQAGPLLLVGFHGAPTRQLGGLRGGASPGPPATAMPHLP